MIILGEDQRIVDFMARRGVTHDWRNFTSIGIEKDGLLVGAVIIDEYFPKARCSLHCAGLGRTWLDKEFLWVVFDYIFRQLECKVIANTVCSSNKDSMRFTEHIGFKKACVIPEGFGDTDLVIYTMHKSECRWLVRGKRNG